MGIVMKLKKERFRSLAYDKAASALRSHGELILSGAQARGIPGIGDGMARRIDTVLHTGELVELNALQQDDDVLSLRQLQAVHGIGAVRAGKLMADGVRTLAQLRAAAAAGTIVLDAAQRVGLRHVEAFGQKIPRSEMQQHEATLQRISTETGPMALLVCGSYRRGKAACGDIDALITCDAPGHTLLDDFVRKLRAAGYVTDDLALGSQKYMGVCKLPGDASLHRRLDLRFMPTERFHFGTLYFTGSNTLNIKMRVRAIELGLTLNEYCLKRADGECIKASSERDIFIALGMAYLEPTQRS